MKKVIAIVVGLGLVFGFQAADQAEANTKVKTYKNCTALNKDHKGGVAKSSKVKNKGGKPNINLLFPKLYTMQIIAKTEIKTELLAKDNILDQRNSPFSGFSS